MKLKLRQKLNSLSELARKFNAPKIGLFKSVKRYSVPKLVLNKSAKKFNARKKIST